MSEHEQDTILRLADYLDDYGNYEWGIVEDRREEAAATLRTISAQLTAALAEIAALRGDRGELAACLTLAIDMLDEYAICNSGENFNNPRFNAALSVKP